jgi:alpha-amylase/alpha-mannosidase (GH57 family)
MKPVRLAILWHMHQPLYREPETGEYLLPWVRLHAIRAYYDMARMLERHEGVRCTVNFTPVLLEQLADYAAGKVHDRFLDLSLRPPADLALAERRFLLRSFFMVDWETVVPTMPRYLELLEKRGRDLRGKDLDAVAASFGDAEIQDLQTLFNLGWFGFAAMEEDGELRGLKEKGRDFDRSDLERVILAQQRIVREIVPAYTRLAASGRVELSSTPYFHPILPLLCDTDCARRALPEAELPPRFAHPGDARWQVNQAMESHARHFGRRPEGMWPAEGSVSPEALEILAAEGVRWAASDEDVLLRSLPPDTARLPALFRPWLVEAGAGQVRMLFRDRGLSDLIGFTYSKNPAEQAVADFTGHLGRIAEAWEGGAEGPTVGVFLDGENPWEHYPDSGRHFLDGLYRALAGTEGLTTATLTTATLSDATATAGGPAISQVHSGSWIEGSFRIWMGHAEDRSAWGALGKARQAVEAAAGAAASQETRDSAWRHLYAAEGSDWFWWYGDDFATDSAAEFDALFRGHLIRACHLVGAAPPPETLQPIKMMEGWGDSPDRPPTGSIRPELDGRITGEGEWEGAGIHLATGARSAMFGGSQPFTALRYGCDHAHLYLRLDPAQKGGRIADEVARLRVVVVGPKGRTEHDFPLKGQVVLGRLAVDAIMEIAIPFAGLGISKGDQVALSVHILGGEVELDRLPRHGHLSLRIPEAESGGRV